MFKGGVHMDTAKNNFATNLKELRQEHSLSQKDFGASIGISAMAISSYESGTKSPSIDTVCRIAETYHVSIDWLCGTGDIKNHSLEIKTYTDLIEILMLLDEIYIDIEKAERSFGSTLGLSPYYLSLTFNDKTLVDFYDEWKEISSIRYKTPTGDKLYNIWLEDVHKRYNYNLPENYLVD